MAYTQIYPMHPPPSDEPATFVGAILVGLACYGLLKIIDSFVIPRMRDKMVKPQSTPQRRSGVDDNQVVVEVIARSSGNTYSDDDFVSVSISGRWFTGMTLREAPYRHAEMCRALTDVGLSIRQFYGGPPPGTHTNGEPFVWAVCRTLEPHLRDDGTPRAVFCVTDNGMRLEEIENLIYKRIPV